MCRNRIFARPIPEIRTYLPGFLFPGGALANNLFQMYIMYICIYVYNTQNAQNVIYDVKCI